VPGVFLGVLKLHVNPQKKPFQKSGTASSYSFKMESFSL